MAEGRRAVGTEPDHVDLDVIRRLHEDVGQDPAITGDVIQTYSRRAPELVAALETAEGSNDADAVRQVAHDLRSISAFVGAESIVVLATELELGRWSADRLTEMTSEVGARLPAVLDELRRFADSL